MSSASATSSFGDERGPRAALPDDVPIRLDLIDVQVEDVVAQVDEAEARLAALRDVPDLSAEPDRAWVDAWLHRSHLAYWGDERRRDIEMGDRPPR